MVSSEAILAKKLDELESELEFLEGLKEPHLLPHPRSAPVRSKLAFLQSLFAAEAGAASSGFASRLSNIAGRVAALDHPETEVFVHAEDSKPAVDLTHVLLHRKLEELESMVTAVSIESPQPLWHPNSAKILSKIAFTRSLLASEKQSEQISSMEARLATVQEAFVHLDAIDASPPSCSRTSSSRTEEVEEESLSPWIVSLRRKIEELEQGVSENGNDDALRKIDFLKSLLAAQMNCKRGEKPWVFDSTVKRFSSIGSGFVDRNQFFGYEDDANGGNVSSPCSCTSSCFDAGQEMEKKTGKDEEEEEEESVSGANNEEELRLPQTMEGKSETAEFAKGRAVTVTAVGSRRTGKLRVMAAMVGLFAIAAAAVGIVIGSCFNEVQPVNLVPT